MSLGIPLFVSFDLPWLSFKVLGLSGHPGFHPLLAYPRQVFSSLVAFRVDILSEPGSGQDLDRPLGRPRGRLIFVSLSQFLVLGIGRHGSPPSSTHMLLGFLNSLLSNARTNRVPLGTFTWFYLK